MRLALIFPPSMPPTSPPCGIAYLKAFLGEGDLFDLNLLYHTTVLTMLKAGVLPVEADVSGYVLEPEHLEEAVAFLKGKEFFDADEYNTKVSIFLNYMKRLIPI